MNRRDFVQVGGSVLAATAAGCLDSSQQATTPSPTTTPHCTPPTTENLVDVLPPAPSELTRSVDADASQAYLNDYNAVAAVSAEYSDGDDAVLDDSTVWVFRFQDNANARREIVEQLNSIEFDSGRVGIGVLLGQTGVIAAAPQRQQAQSLLARSPAVSTQCLDSHKLLPAKTKTPATGDETQRETATES